MVADEAEGDTSISEIKVLKIKLFGEAVEPVAAADDKKNEFPGVTI